MRHLGSCAVAMTAIFLLTGCERAKTKLDREVDRLCAVDGGVHVYETVKLPKENFGPGGEVFPEYRAQIRSGGGLGPDFTWNTNVREIVAGDPSLTRWEQSISRVQDGKLLGKRVVYIRGGGDFLGPWGTSEYSCRNVPSDLTQKVFFQ